MTKEEFYEQTLRDRKAVVHDSVNKCSCPNVKCDLHGNCKTCVALHRYYKEHLPACLQFLVADKVKALSGVVEMTMTKKVGEGIPDEYRQYVKDQDALNGANA